MQVCSLLGLAHLYEATELERNCLKFMAANMANVVARPDFTSLSADCLVKFNMHCAGVEPAGPSGGVMREAQARRDGCLLASDSDL